MSGFLLFFKIVGLLDELDVKTLIYNVDAYALHDSALGHYVASFSDQIPNWIQAQNAFLDANYGMQSIMSPRCSCGA